MEGDHESSSSTYVTRTEKLLTIMQDMEIPMAHALRKMQMEKNSDQTSSQKPNEIRRSSIIRKHTAMNQTLAKKTSEMNRLPTI